LIIIIIIMNIKGRFANWFLTVMEWNRGPKVLILTFDMLELPLEVFLVQTPHSHAEEGGGGVSPDFKRWKREKNFWGVEISNSGTFFGWENLGSSFGGIRKNLKIHGSVHVSQAHFFFSKVQPNLLRLGNSAWDFWGV